MKKFYLLIISSVFIFSSCTYCDKLNEQTNKTFTGVVFDKNEYEWDRGIRVLTIINEGKSKLKYYFPKDYELDNSWRAISVGDSVYIKENTKTFYVLRLGSLVDKFEMNFDCLD
ncbi:hypothetical protein LV84_03248 [Algoriphagus ratkowskyi]|uniref:Lipoprotein n=1 Tax=Algoriphagus ratkowskyi TaxID=57028 RepID=A0A2W7QZ21_9BACT|nr:hypothetical protein [Algoriphagus ratkowskyi]PZX53524.1 hypothetical protein LV84_03248 [Algoriphagus ratkowskyi]